MKNRVIFLLYLIITCINVTVYTMEQQEQPAAWEKLPHELKSYILSLAAHGETLAQILESLKSGTQVNKEFRALIKSLAQDSTAVVNIAKKYIETHPKSVYQEFFGAIIAENKGVLRALINGGINVNFKNANGDAPLIVAAQGIDIDIVKMLLDAGANINEQNSLGFTPLMIATSNNIIKLLLDRGADVNITDKIHRTALTQALNNENRDKVKLILQKGVAPTTIRILLTGLNNKQVDLLIASGVDVNAQDKKNNTALLIAAFTGKKERVEQLLKNGADPNIVNHSGRTPLMIIQDYLARESNLPSSRIETLNAIADLLKKYAN